MGCCCSTATPAPSELVGTWRGAVTTITIHSTGEVDYHRETENSTTTYTGGMQWSENMGVGRICCITQVINVEEPPKSDGGGIVTVTINGEKLTKSSN